MDAASVRPFIKVSKSTLLRNLALLRERVSPAVRFAPVLKANAWGHGLELVAAAISEHAELLAVAEPDDALALTPYAPSRVVCLGPTSGRQLRELCSAGVQVSIADVAAAADLPPGALVHVLVDTGLHRLGVLPEETRELIHAVEARGAHIEAVFCHVAGADRGDWPAVEAEVAALHQVSGRWPVHCGGSSLIIERPDLVGEIARPGIALYGYLPNVRQSAHMNVGPALSLWAPVIQVRALERGTTVGYEQRRLERDTIVATIAIGVGHGLDSNLARVGASVLLGSVPCPLVADPMLDYILVDARGVPSIAPGDMSLVLGGPHGSPTSVAEMARQLAQSPEHLIVRLAAQLERRLTA